jgi:hypothetical protein
MSAIAAEQEIRSRAINHHDCPTCGARAGVRCRILTQNITTPTRTNVDVRKKPCPERASLGWREMLAEMREAVA